MYISLLAKVTYRYAIPNHRPDHGIGYHGASMAMPASFHLHPVLVLHEEANVLMLPLFKGGPVFQRQKGWEAIHKARLPTPT